MQGCLEHPLSAAHTQLSSTAAKWAWIEVLLWKRDFGVDQPQQQSSAAVVEVPPNLQKECVHKNYSPLKEISHATIYIL